MAEAVERAEAERLVAAPKDALGAPTVWQEYQSPVSGVVLRKALFVPVVSDPLPSAGDLLVVGEWRSPEQIQLFLQLQRGQGIAILARLCLTPGHGSDVHWHFYEGAKGNEVPGGLSQPLVTIDEDAMLYDEFIPRLKITNVARSML